MKKWADNIYEIYVDGELITSSQYIISDDSIIFKKVDRFSAPLEKVAHMGSGKQPYDYHNVLIKSNDYEDAYINIRFVEEDEPTFVKVSRKEYIDQETENNLTLIDRFSEFASGKAPYGESKIYDGKPEEFDLSPYKVDLFNQYSDKLKYNESEMKWIVNGEGASIKDNKLILENISIASIIAEIRGVRSNPLFFSLREDDNYYRIDNVVKSTARFSIDKQDNILAAGRVQISIVPSKDGDYYGVNNLKAGEKQFLAGSKNEEDRKGSAISYIREHGVGDGKLSNANFGNVKTLCVDDKGTVYLFDDAIKSIRKITEDGMIETIVPSGYPGEIVKDNAKSNYITGSVGEMKTDSKGNLFYTNYSTDEISMIPKEDGKYYGQDMKANKIYKIVGNGKRFDRYKPGFNLEESKFEEGLKDSVNVGIVYGAFDFDKNGNIVFVDEGNELIRKVDKDTGMITNLYGYGKEIGDGYDLNKTSISPVSIAFDSNNNLYFGDVYGGYKYSVRKIDPKTGKVKTIVNGEKANRSFQAFHDEESNGGEAIRTRLDRPVSLAFDSNDDLYIWDSNFTGELSGGSVFKVNIPQSEKIRPQYKLDGDDSQKPNPTPEEQDKDKNNPPKKDETPDKDDEKKPIKFSDLSDEHWAKEFIDKLVGLKGITGYPDGTFKPENNITRAEFASILVKSLNLENKSGKVFSDTEKHWAKEVIAAANEAGIVKGMNENEFAPDEKISREQMAAMIVRAVELSDEADSKRFKDEDAISDWAKEYVDQATKQGIIEGYPDGSFKPLDNATRAEASKVISVAIDKNKK